MSDLHLLPNLKGFAKAPEKPADLAELVPHTDPILREVMPEFDFRSGDAVALAKRIADAMIWYEGIGLSANQIGLRVRAFAMRTNPVIVCFNPQIVLTSAEADEMLEGCLSFPGIGVKRKRFRGIKVRYWEPNGGVVNTKFSNMTARIFQHELDHLNGLFFTDTLSRLQLERTLKKASKNGFKYTMPQFKKPADIEVKEASEKEANPFEVDLSIFNGGNR